MEADTYKDDMEDVDLDYGMYHQWRLVFKYNEAGRDD